MRIRAWSAPFAPPTLADPRLQREVTVRPSKAGGRTHRGPKTFGVSSSRRFVVVTIGCVLAARYLDDEDVERVFLMHRDAPAKGRPA